MTQTLQEDVILYAKYYVKYRTSKTCHSGLNFENKNSMQLYIIYVFLKQSHMKKNKVKQHVLYLYMYVFQVIKYYKIDKESRYQNI